MTKDELLKHKEQIMQIAAQHGVLSVRVFGSVARDEATQESDLDVLIEPGSHLSAWFPAGLILDLETLLGCKVDIVTEKALNPLFRDQVLTEAIRL